MSDTPPTLDLSVVIPVFNSEATLEGLVERIFQTLEPRYSLEVVLVDDASRDNSFAVCRRLAERFPGRLRAVRLGRNFGEHHAVICGLGYTRGASVVVMDDDGQNAPEDVLPLVEALRSGGFDVVYSRYPLKRHSWLRNIGSWFNDRAANILLDKPRGLYLSSFKAMSRWLVGEVVRYRGPYPYLDGLILRVTRHIGHVEVEHHERVSGKSNYTLGKLAGLWMNMFTNFSILPLRLATFLGLVLSLLGGLLAIYWVVVRFIREQPPGWTTTIVVMVLFCGIQLFVVGMIGEYLGRLFLSQNGTPQYVVRETIGVDK